MKKLSLFMLLMLTLSSSVRNAQAFIDLGILSVCGLHMGAVNNELQKLATAAKSLLPAITLGAAAGALLYPFYSPNDIIHIENRGEGAILGATIIGTLSALAKSMKFMYELSRYKSELLKNNTWPQEAVDSINNARTMSEIDGLVEIYTNEVTYKERYIHGLKHTVSNINHSPQAIELLNRINADPELKNDLINIVRRS